MKKILMILLALCGAAGCAPRQQNQQAVLLSSVRPPPEQRVETVVPLLRSKVVQVLDSNHAINYIRLVQVFSSENDPSSKYPQYHMFDIRPGSIGELLQLQEGDILVSANDYVVFNPETFARYLELFRTEKDPYIEIVRKGHPMLLRYHFIE